VHRSGTEGRTALEDTREVDFDLVDAEHGGRAWRAAPGRQRRGEAVIDGLVAAAIGEEAVAARNLAVSQTTDARALAARGPEPCRIFAVSDHRTAYEPSAPGVSQQLEAAEANR